jgi:hypothetical protein
MTRRSDGFPAALLVTALVFAWSAAVAVASASSKPIAPQTGAAAAPQQAAAATDTTNGQAAPTPA